VTLGAYELDPVLVHKITNSEPVELSEDSLTLPDGAQLSDGKIYVGADPAKAEIGDLRISESMVPTGAVSVIAKQGPGTRLTPFHAKAGEDIGLVEPGTKSAEEMFLTAQSESRLLTWGLRACGFVLLFFGFLLFLGPISTMSSIIPFLGGLVEAGVFIISLLAAIAVWTLLVGMAWMVARPLLGGALLLLAIAAAFFLIRHMRKHAAAGRARAAA
jgi:hypothetical protein